jgi:hypothetical protein
MTTEVRTVTTLPGKRAEILSSISLYEKRLRGVFFPRLSSGFGSQPIFYAEIAIVDVTT